MSHICHSARFEFSTATPCVTARLPCVSSCLCLSVTLCRDVFCISPGVIPLVSLVVLEIHVSCNDWHPRWPHCISALFGGTRILHQEKCHFIVQQTYSSRKNVGRMHGTIRACSRLSDLVNIALWTKKFDSTSKGRPAVGQVILRLICATRERRWCTMAGEVSMNREEVDSISNEDGRLPSKKQRGHGPLDPWALIFAKVVPDGHLDEPERHEKPHDNCNPADRAKRHKAQERDRD